jgi:chemotaxis protein methyltransferase CheR
VATTLPGREGVTRVGLDLSDADLARVGSLVHEIAGIALPPNKHAMVRSRLATRARTLGLPSVGAYLEHVENDASGGELAAMIDALTTNKTYFFREEAHFDLLRHRVFPDLAERSGPIRLWSAGCSTGEEAYCMAVLALETFGERAPRDVRILGTDISQRVLNVARPGEYAAENVSAIPAPTLARMFESVPHGNRRSYRVRAELRALVRFARLNLMSNWPMRGPFDVIFCRNVMIYFDRPTRERLVRRLAELLTPGGYLCIGHSESLTGFSPGLEFVQPATYRR